MLAQGMCPEGKRIAVVDTENESASLYADIVDFDTLNMTNHDPREFIKVIKAAEADKNIGVLIIDSLSHEWQGTGGYLDIMNDEAKRIKGGNTFAANKVPADLHKKLIQVITASTVHIICTLRSKKKYIDTDENGRRGKKVVGMEPITKEGTEFEFDVFAEMDLDGNTFIIEKTRIFKANGMVIGKPTPEVGKLLVEYLNENAEEVLPINGNELSVETAPPPIVAQPVQVQVANDVPAPAVLPVSEAPKVAYLTKMQVDDLKAMAKDTGYTPEQFGKVLSSMNIQSIKEIPKALFNILAAKYKDKGLLIGL